MAREIARQIVRDSSVEPLGASDQTQDRPHPAEPTQHAICSQPRANVPKLVDRLRLVEDQGEASQSHVMKEGGERLHTRQSLTALVAVAGPTQVSSEEDRPFPRIVQRYLVSVLMARDQACTDHDSCHSDATLAASARRSRSEESSSHLRTILRR